MDESCPDPLLAEAIALAGNDDVSGRERVAALLGDYPSDPRLHFLYGSLLAAEGRYEEARMAMRQSITLAPDYEIARFQLGLLELSSGDAAAADLTLEPLAAGRSESALALFARGLRHLARDELATAADLLRRGIACNPDHPLVSRDMELIIARIEEEGGATQEEKGEPVSAAHLLLQEYAAKSTKH
jgi:tetratricopeptide (TPR) repeat protein